MGFPLPEGLTWEAKIVLWCSIGLVCLLGLLSAWLIQRYINSNDDHHQKVEATLGRHAEAMSGLTDKITNHQHGMASSLIEIHKMTGEIKSDLAESNASVSVMKHELNGIVSTVTEHHKSIADQGKEISNIKRKITKRRTK